jgi:PAS domain S-box-containing protein
MDLKKTSLFRLINRKDLLLFIVLLIAGLSLFGWIMGKLVIPSVSLKFIPMAPSSALIFFLLSLSLILKINFDKKTVLQPITTIVILLSASFCLFIMLDYFFKFTLDIEKIFISNPERFGNVQIGRMSPISSILFFCTCVGIFAGEKHVFEKIRYVGGAFSLLTFCIAIILLLGYLYKAPLLYGGQIIPVALLTSICFFLFSITLLRKSELKYWTFNLIKENQTELQLLRTFLPLVVFIIVLQGFLETNVSINQNNHTLTSAIMILIIVVVTIFIIIRASSILGNKLTSAEKKLRDSEEFSRSILQTIPFGMDIVAENGVLLFQNETLRTLFGDEAMGEKCWNLYRDDKTQCKKCPLKTEFKIGTTKIIESTSVLGGRTFEIVHTGILFEGKKAMLEIFIDITNRKNTEKEIQLKNEELQKLNVEKDKFFSIIAHDLRSPFNSFLGFTEMMVDEMENMTLKELHHMAVDMRKSTNGIYNLLENLLEWSRLQRGIITFNPVLFLLSPKIAENMHSVLEAATKKEIDFSFDIPKNLEIYADENMFSSIIRNLTSNAVKFTPKGGKIKLSVKVIGEKSVEISIADSGIGMSREMIDNLFITNSPTNRKGTDGEPSTGLGLIICKEFIEKHGGKIWVETNSNPDVKGSTFCFSIPQINAL